MSPHVNLSYENGFDLHENELSGKQIFCHMNGFTQRLPEDNSKMTSFRLTCTGTPEQNFNLSNILVT